MEGLVWIYSKNTGNAKDDLSIKQLKVEEATSTISIDRQPILRTIISQAMPILRPPYLKYLIVSFLIVFALFFTYVKLLEVILAEINLLLNCRNISLGLWYMEIENHLHESTSQGGTLCGVLMSKPLVNKSDESGEDCHDTLSSEEYMPAFILGSIYSLAFIVISCLSLLIERGWISCKFFCLKSVNSSA